MGLDKDWNCEPTCVGIQRVHHNKAEQEICQEQWKNALKNAQCTHYRENVLPKETSAGV